MIIEDISPDERIVTIHRVDQFDPSGGCPAGSSGVECDKRGGCYSYHQRKLVKPVWVDVPGSVLWLSPPTLNEETGRYEWEN